MRIIASLIITLMSMTLILSLQHTYAVCDITSQSSASDYLKGCADNPDNAINPDQGGGGSTAIKSLIIKISQRVIAFGALFAIGAIVFSGIQYTTSYGDDEKVKKAKSTAIYALIGLVLLLVAFPLVDVVIGFVYRLGQ